MRGPLFNDEIGVHKRLAGLLDAAAVGQAGLAAFLESLLAQAGRELRRRAVSAGRDPVR